MALTKRVNLIESKMKRTGKIIFSSDKEAPVNAKPDDLVVSWQSPDSPKRRQVNDGLVSA